MVILLPILFVTVVTIQLIEILFEVTVKQSCLWKISLSAKRYASFLRLLAERYEKEGINAESLCKISKEIDEFGNHIDNSKTDPIIQKKLKKQNIEIAFSKKINFDKAGTSVQEDLIIAQNLLTMMMSLANGISNPFSFKVLFSIFKLKKIYSYLKKIDQVTTLFMQSKMTPQPREIAL
jgi:hypothetical protein